MLNYHCCQSKVIFIVLMSLYMFSIKYQNVLLVSSPHHPGCNFSINVNLFCALVGRGWMDPLALNLFCSWVPASEIPQNPDTHEHNTPLFIQREKKCGPVSCCMGAF